MIKMKGCKLSNKSDHPSENALNFYETNNYFSTNSLNVKKSVGRICIHTYIHTCFLFGVLYNKNYINYFEITKITNNKNS